MGRRPLQPRLPLRTLSLSAGGSSGGFSSLSFPRSRCCSSLSPPRSRCCTQRLPGRAHPRPVLRARTPLLPAGARGSNACSPSPRRFRRLGVTPQLSGRGAAAGTAAGAAAQAASGTRRSPRQCRVVAALQLALAALQAVTLVMTAAVRAVRCSAIQCCLGKEPPPLVFSLPMRELSSS